MYFTIFVTICVIFVYHVYKNRKIYWLSWQLEGPFALPFIGNALNFFCKDEDLLDRCVELCSKYPSPFRLWFGPKFTIVVTDAEQAQKILSSYNFLTKDPGLYKFLEEFDGKGLITSTGIKWKKDRRLISPMFSKKNISQYFTIVQDQTKILINILKHQCDKPTFNIEPFIHRCTVDFVNRVLFGAKTRAQYGEMDTYLKLLHRVYTIVHARIVKIWLQSDFIFKLSSYWVDHEVGKKSTFKFIDEAIENNENPHLEMQQTHQTIIQQLIGLKNEETGFCEHTDLQHHLITLFSASEDTVTLIVSFALVLLGQYQDIQNKVIEEINKVVGKDKVNEKHLDQLEYLDMVIKEVLRLFPIASFLIRVAEDEVCIFDKYIVPKGCSVIVSIYNIHRDIKYWQKPNDFYPEHFLPESTRKRHPYAFIPFSAGPRSCIGKHFAYMSLKITLVTILQNFVVESDGKLCDLQLKTDISIRPKNECFPVRLKLRN